MGVGGEKRSNSISVREYVVEGGGFKELLKAGGKDSTIEVGVLVGTTLSLTALGLKRPTKLEESLSVDEVFSALSNLNGDKAPSPEGFSLAFWQFYWDFVKDKRWAEDLSDFRPISLVGGLYKLLAKVLANRLKKVVGKVVSSTQNAFVEENAYDRINWDFLLSVMQKMGFGEKWVSDRVSLRSPHFLPEPLRTTSSPSDLHHAGNLFRRTFPVTSFSDTDHTKRSAWKRSPTSSKASEPENPPRAGHAHFSGRRLNLTRRRVRARETFSDDAPPPPASPDADQHPYLPGSPIRALHVPLLGIFVSVSPPNRLSGEVPATFSPTPIPARALGSVLLPFWCENYRSWSASVELWFMGQGYEDHLVTQEADIPEVDRVQWRKIDAQLCSVLWQSVDPRILLHLQAYKTCFKFWTQAKGLYTNDIQRLYKVASAIVHLSQQDLNLSTYIGQIASLKEEFLTAMPLTPDVGAQQTQLDKFFMVLTLIGLCPDLESIRDQILGSSSVPSLDDVFARLLLVPEGRGQRPHCTYCNKLGHTRDRCYQLHGRPPRTAHMAQSSDSPLPQPPSSSASQTSQAPIAPVAQPGNASACLTHTSSLGPWILDSGASDHLSGNKDLFSSITTTSALPTVTLANGSQTVAKGIGLALPLPSLPLTSVLYTPECPFNLIFISKITRTLNCSITFSDKFVTLQDRSTGKTIGIGRESQGLYHLTSDSSPAVCISTDAPLLIHNRLGHPSLSKFQKMVPRFSTLSSLPCESCQLGKHTRVSFPKRLNNRAKSPFELVHTDVWGPCWTASTLGFQYFVTFIDDYSRLTMPGNIFQPNLLRLCLIMAFFISLLVLILLNKMGQLNTRIDILLRQLIPHSLLFPDQPLYFLPPRVFGCTCFVHILTPAQDKLSAKAMKCLFLGYSRLQKGYRCYSLETHRYFISADVTFFEDSPFFSTTSESLPVSEVLPIPIVSPPDAMPPRPLQVYHRRPRVVAPLPFPEAPADSLPIPSASPASALPSPNDLPIAVRKGTHSTRNPHPIYNFLSYHRLSSPYSAFVSAISSVSLPKSTHEALSHPGWRQAMVDEMAALHSNGTWDLVVLPSGKSTVGCRWVYAVKVGPDGQVDRLKARLVAKGYTQVYGSHYGDTFSPVAKIASVRLLLSMAAMCSWPLYQLNIKNVFLHGDLAEEVYMEQPPGFVAQGESGLVCRLRRSLYGLKQSPRAWFSRFSSVVQEFGMLRSTTDHSVFYHHNSLGQCIYLTKDLGKLKYFLGIEIAQSSSGVVLSQRKTGGALGDPGRYRRLVGKLNYLTITHPDISFPVSVVSQFLQSPCDSHWDAIGLAHPQIDVPLQGTVFFIEGNLISWKSKKQDVVVRSSAEAEYRAMALATCELIWLRHLLQELRFGKDEQMKLICDNQAALHIASNPVFMKGPSILKLQDRGREGVGIQVTHLLFADDTLVFCDDSQEQLVFLSWLLMWFEAISGLRINLNKSEIFSVGKVENAELLTAELGCKVGSLPSTYLGLPLGASHKSVKV
ncbi:Retrovirus-related Pol polyprotein from transposon RE2 [Vitis vinifera]|uniref:Retrovirus-related Pol polyprotein from transposon RE2 n=1 Tax=Vitis vinifera TaxID=29760 RepID=A0A438FG10_VITVI|nr:Retrovirus-related Pol polyprotein from transposon RE2 [Vitis vinifera]